MAKGIYILKWKVREWKCGVEIVMCNGMAGDGERIPEAQSVN